MKFAAGHLELANNGEHFRADLQKTTADVVRLKDQLHDLQKSTQRSRLLGGNGLQREPAQLSPDLREALKHGLANVGVSTSGGETAGENTSAASDPRSGHPRVESRGESAAFNRQFNAENDASIRRQTGRGSRASDRAELGENAALDLSPGQPGFAGVEQYSRNLQTAGDPASEKAIVQRDAIAALLEKIRLQGATEKKAQPAIAGGGA